MWIGWGIQGVCLANFHHVDWMGDSGWFALLTYTMWIGWGIQGVCLANLHHVDWMGVRVIQGVCLANLQHVDCMDGGFRVFALLTSTMWIGWGLG